jgi:hypothetical protein
MLKRELFITNSSSSSHIVYGVKLTGDKVDELINKLSKDNYQAFRDELINYHGEEEVNERGENAVELIIEMDEWEYFISDFLPKGITLVRNYDNDYDRTCYLDLDGSLQSEVIDGKVVLTDMSAVAHMKLEELTKSLGVKRTEAKPNLHTWVSYNG